jgi:tight adherence protein B
MGAMLGLTFGTGLLLVWQWWRAPEKQPSERRGASKRRRNADLIAEAGIEAVTPQQLVASCAAAGALAALAFLVLSRDLKYTPDIGSSDKPLPEPAHTHPRTDLPEAS